MTSTLCASGLEGDPLGADAISTAAGAELLPSAAILLRLTGVAVNIILIFYKKKNKRPCIIPASVNNILTI